MNAKAVRKAIHAEIGLIWLLKPEGFHDPSLKLKPMNPSRAKIKKWNESIMRAP